MNKKLKITVAGLSACIAIGVQSPMTSYAKNSTQNENYKITVASDQTTGVPGAFSISKDKWSGESDYTITMSMYWGNNGDSWKLYENGKLISEQKLTNNSPNPQKSEVKFTDKHNGTYVYTAELINKFGVTKSTESVTVEVTQGKVDDSVDLPEKAQSNPAIGFKLIDQNDSTVNWMVYVANPNKGYVWDGTNFAVWSVSFNTTAKVDEVKGAQSFKQEGNKVTIYLNSYENLLGANTIRKFYIKAEKQGNSLEPSNFTVDKFRGNIPYPEHNKLPATWKANNKQLEMKDLIDDTKDYYDTTVKSQDNKFIVYNEPHKTQFILGLAKQVDYPVNGVNGLRMYMPSKYLAMGLAFDYEFFKINPSYMCALSTKENFTCGIVPQESGYTENPVKVDGKTWYWPIQIKHPDGPFQQETGNFNECKGQYQDYLSANAKHEDYTQLNDGKETDTKWVRAAISSGISLTMTREFLYAVPKLNFGDFVKNANDKWAEFVCVDNAYNRGVYGFLQRNLFTDNRERSLKTNDLNKEYDLSGFAHHIENVRAMTEAMNKETQNIYDSKLTWEDVNNFLDETRYFYQNGTPTDEEWNNMKADVKKAFDLLSAKWGDNTCSLRYDFLTLLRVEKEHLPAPYNPSPTGATWIEQVTGANR